MNTKSTGNTSTGGEKKRGALMGAPMRTELHDSALNSPYEVPLKHWAQNQKGHLTTEKRPGRRPSAIKTIIVPQAEGVSSPNEGDMLDDPQAEAQSETNRLINQIRTHLDAWRKRPIGSRGVTDTTRKLLQYWRDPDREFKLFFCQLEAIETLIWLAEVAPKERKRQLGLPSGRDILKKLRQFKELDSSDLLLRIATKMATGTGKTTVMAMIIAWHYLNHRRNPRSSYASQFLVITPGITIKNRLEVLRPEDPSNEYQAKDLIPPEFRSRGNGITGARVIVANYHKLIPQKPEKIHANTKEILGKDSRVLQEEPSRAVLERLLGAEALRPGSPLLVLNDEAHHCYRSRTQASSDGRKRSKASSDDDDGLNTKEEETRAHVWISGLEALAKELKPKRRKKKSWRLTVHDLSATPFYLRGSGHAEGTLFPWVVSDFSLLDAIESGLVKLPRVPVKDTSSQERPVYREIYKKIRKELPGSKSRSKSGKKVSRSHGAREPLPALLEEALETLYERYKETYELWQGQKGESHGTELFVPPVFLVICNNTSLSKRMYDHIAGYPGKDGSFQEGKLALFSQDPQNGGPLRTLLVDSQQLQKLESGEKASVDPEHEHFRKHVEAFREKKRAAGALNEEEHDSPDGSSAESLGGVLRQIVNTVGKPGQIGEQIRCLIAVSMLTEGWDANNVTHILGIRSFGTRLLCEQIVGRGLRRMSYSLDENQRLAAEYVNIFGIEFDFAPNSSAPSVPKGTVATTIHAVPEKEKFALRFPKLVGYTLENKKGRLVCHFDPEGSRYRPDPSQTPEETTIQGIIGKSETMSLKDRLAKLRIKEVIVQLANRVLERYLQGEVGARNASFGRAQIFAQLYPHVEHWYRHFFEPYGQHTKKHLAISGTMMAEAVNIIHRALRPMEGTEERRLIPLLKPGQEEGSTHDVNYKSFTQHNRIWDSTEKSHLNKAVTDSSWEYELCQMLEENRYVLAWARNSRSLDFAIPYAYEGYVHTYYPDFIARIQVGLHETDCTFYIIETKGERDDRDRAKAATARRQWVTAVNAELHEDPATGELVPRWGRWAFLELTDIHQARLELAKCTAIPRKHHENTAF